VQLGNVSVAVLSVQKAMSSERQKRWCIPDGWRKRVQARAAAKGNAWLPSIKRLVGLTI